MATNSRWPLQDEPAGPKRLSTVVVSEFDERRGKTNMGETLVVGTTNLYVNGQLRLIPVSISCRVNFGVSLTSLKMPTPDPKGETC